MSQPASVFDDLTPADLKIIRARGTSRRFSAGEPIFAEGDVADFIYFIDAGRVSIYIQKFTRQEEICILGPGDYFGEMAIFNRDKRTASAKALEDTVLVSVDKNELVRLLEREPAIADSIRHLLARRNEELALKESLIDLTGIHHRHLHIGIKGDPSLRETAFTRERYQSPVDKVIHQLPDSLEELLINRCVYEVAIAFNSGEIHTHSVLDPFRIEIHPVTKIVDDAYLDRHFPRIPYADKTAAVRRVYSLLDSEAALDTAPEHLRKIILKNHDDWEPVTPQEIRETVQRLPALRDIPDFYLRSFTLSMTHDAIRMQFNCDGTHIVSTDSYQQFLDENLESG